MPSQTQQRSLFYGTFIDAPAYGAVRIRHDTILGVGEDGRIAFIESEVPADQVSLTIARHGWPESDLHRISAPDSTSFFFPGFIDTHTHASQYPNTGLFGNSTLLDWLDTYTFPLESSFTDLRRARRIYERVVARSLSHGTTCAAYYATVHVPATNLLADVCLARGQRALVGRVCMDRLSPEHYRDESPEAAAAATEACIAHTHAIDPQGSLVRPCVTPRFAPSCTMESMKALAAVRARHDCFAQTHVSENHPEIALVGEMFPSADHYVGVYEDAGLLSDKTILAHAVHLLPAEIQLLRAHGTAVSHCPASNTSLTSGAAPVQALVDAGLTVGLGTDMSGGYAASILEMARQAMLVSRHVAMTEGDSAKLTAEQVLYLATGGGAASVGLAGTVGVFDVGYDFDAQLVRLAKVPEGQTEDDYALDTTLGPVDLFGWESWPDVIQKWLYTGDDRNVQRVYVKGRLVHEANR